MAITIFAKQIGKFIGAFRNACGYEKYQYNEEIIIFIKRNRKILILFLTGKWKDFSGLRFAIMKEIQLNVSTQRRYTQ